MSLRRSFTEIVVASQQTARYQSGTDFLPNVYWDMSTSTRSELRCWQYSSDVPVITNTDRIKTLFTYLSNYIHIAYVFIAQRLPCHSTHAQAGGVTRQPQGM